MRMISFLFLGDANYLLIAAINIIKRFGMFPGLSINWEKSVLPIDELKRELPESVRYLQIVESLEYLGINIELNPKLYIQKNLEPLIKVRENVSGVVSLCQ